MNQVLIATTILKETRYKQKSTDTLQRETIVMHPIHMRMDTMDNTWVERDLLKSWKLFLMY